MGFVNEMPIDYTLLYVCAGLCLNVKSGLWVHVCVCFLRKIDPAVSAANGSGLVSARLWIEINTMDNAIKALFVPFVPTG